MTIAVFFGNACQTKAGHIPKLASLMRCPGVIYGWMPGDPLVDSTLHVTSATIEPNSRLPGVTYIEYRPKRRLCQSCGINKVPCGSISKICTPCELRACQGFYRGNSNQTDRKTL